MSKYALAYCSGGLLGLITSEVPLDIQYNDGNWGRAWVGLQVTGGTIAGRGGDTGKTFRRYPGTPWSSSKPRIIAQLSPLEGEELELQLKALAIADYTPGATP